LIENGHYKGGDQNYPECPRNSSQISMNKEKIVEKLFKSHAEIHPPEIPRGGVEKNLVTEAHSHVDSCHQNNYYVNRIKTKKPLEEETQKTS